MDLLRRVLGHPTTNILVALVLIASGIADSRETMLEEVLGIDAGVDHGVLVLGCVHFLRATAELLEGTKRIARADP